MLDDLVELAVDIGGEILEAVVEYKMNRKKEKKNSGQRKSNSNRIEDPWEKEHETPPWEG